jgi:hypothetical protein
MNTTEDLIVDEVRELLKNENLWTPLFLATKFFEMNSQKQANFFNYLAILNEEFRKKTRFPVEIQWVYIKEYLTKDAKQLINSIREFANEKSL